MHTGEVLAVSGCRHQVLWGGYARHPTDVSAGSCQQGIGLQNWEHLGAARREVIVKCRLR